MGNPEQQKTKVEQTLELLAGMQKLKLVPVDLKVTEQGVELTGVTEWHDPMDELRRGAR